MSPTARRIMFALALMAGATTLGRAALAADTQTIAFVRHGEKPGKGLGQLTCQGLNRSLALPAVLAKMFGKPAAIFAPDPSHQKDDDGIAYDYVRPLATIEPTAIADGMPIHSGIGVDDLAGLRTELEQPAYRRAVVLVAWEHRDIETLARTLMTAHGADPAVVPKWQASDFDSIYIVRLAWTGDTATATFERRREYLDGRPTACPK